MKTKQNILVCGTSQPHIAELIEEITGFEDELVEMEDEADEKHGMSKLICNIISTPVANYVEARALVPFPEDGDGPACCGEMGDYVKAVEDELASRRLLTDGDSKIDAVWYCLGDKTDFAEEMEQDFIRSAASVPGAYIIADPGFSTRSGFKETMDFLAGLCGHRIVLESVVVQPDALVTCGLSQLVERTRNLYLGDPEISNADRDSFRAAWTDFHCEMLEEWDEYREQTISYVVHSAAERAQSILKRNEMTELGRSIGACISLTADLFKTVKGEADADSMKRKTKADLAKWEHLSVNEVKFNIVCMIYEVGACTGRIVPRYAVRELLSLIPSDFPKDAVAVTFAIGSAAVALSGDYFWQLKNVRAVFEQAKENAREMEFEPFDDSMIMRSEEDDVEPEFGDDDGEDDDSDVCGEDMACAGSETGNAPEEEISDEAFFKHVSEKIRQSMAELEEDGGASRPKSEGMTSAQETAPVNPPLLPVVLANLNAGNGDTGTAKAEGKPKKARKPAKTGAKTKSDSRAGRSRSTRGRRDGRG